jgi:nicotinamide-nucleotide amidase
MSVESVTINTAILSIGNEVVEGQINNTNASWLSSQLENLGLPVQFQVSSKDNLTDICDCLDFLSQRCSLIIISGGLGPTKDDLTRDAIEKWSNCKLSLDSQSLQAIRAKVEGRGIPLRPGHERQAMLPVGSHVLPNHRGVAPGFILTTDSGCTLAALPGPPMELQAMFKEELQERLLSLFEPKPDSQLQTWVCLGAAESEVAHVVESIIGDSFPIGFRLAKPYIEVKLWLPNNLNPQQRRVIELMETKLNPWLVGRTILEIREQFFHHINQFQNIFIIDHLTSGLFLEKIRETKPMDNLRYQCFEQKSQNFLSADKVKSVLTHLNVGHSRTDFYMSLFPNSINSAWLSLNQELHLIEIPKRIPISSELGLLYVIEQCFLTAAKTLSRS